MMKAFYFKGLTIKHQAPITDSVRAIILCPGLPASSLNEERIGVLVDRNFHVFSVVYPGYPGSSRTPFLSNNPANLIGEFIHFLRIGGLPGVSLDSFSLIGSSFGGSVALNVSGADKVVAISPVVDYRNLYSGDLNHNYDTLKDHLQKGGYSIDQSGWGRLKRGKLFSFMPTVPSRNVLVVYNQNDREINPGALKRFVRRRGFSSVAIKSGKHLSFKNAPPDVFQRILFWLEESDLFSRYNNDVNAQLQKFVSPIARGGSAVLVTGSLACGNLVPESDIDLLVISERSKIKIPSTMQGHPVEAKVLSFRAFSDYVSRNMRGMSRLFNSKVFTDSQGLRRKIEKLRSRLRDRYLGVFLVFQFLERKRMEASIYTNATSPLSLKKGTGGRRSLGFMATTYNAMNHIDNPSFWNSLGLLVSDGVITETDRERVKIFFNELTRHAGGDSKLGKRLRGNGRIVEAYTNAYFLKAVRKATGFALPQNVQKARSGSKGYAGDVLDAFYSSDKALLAKIAKTYKSQKDAIKKHVIFYYLALNGNLPLEIGESIALGFSGERSMNNVRRNLVESPISDNHRALLRILAKDPDQKVRYYAKRKLLNRKVLRTEPIRYS